MKEWEKSSFGWGRSGEPNTGSATNSLKKEKFDIYKFVVASVLILGLGVCFSEQALADEDGGGGSRPVIAAKVTGTRGNNGWYKSNVSVAWTVTSSGSAITNKSGCGPASVTTDTAGVTFTCSATNRYGTASRSVTIKRDTVPPKATITTPTNGATYTQNQAVAASYSCTDATAGVAACVGTVARGANIDTSTSGTKTFKVTATDRAGNTTNKLINYTVSGSPVVGAPVVTPTVTGTQGTNGWYTGNVGVTWTVSDPAATKSAGCSNVSLTTDTAGVTYTCTATNSTGATTKSVTIKRDAAPPSTTIVAPISGATYTQNQAVKASYTCTDSTAGVAACTGTIASGANLDTSTAGTKSFSVTASDQAGNTTNKSISYTVGVVSANGTHLFAWNDLGMHCADSDFSIFTLLPPFNDLNAQLVVNGKLIDATTNSAYKLTYQSTPDPTGSVNSFSESKTNFWTYDQPLFGADLAPNIGLTGNPTPSYTPAPLAWDATYNWFEASGIPIIPIDDNLNANYFPMVRVTALDSTGKAVASSDTVLPVSSEINCGTCHASVTGSAAAKPTAGWVNPTPTNTEQDWRLNILRLHDQKNVGANYTALLTQKGYGASLETSARVNGKPVLCDSCHNSNALAVWGIKGMPGAVSNMTAAMHNRHANVTLPGASQTLNSIATRDSCYNCHPGQKTECLRGAMGNAVDATGKHTMECQACHGSMTTVGNNAREGWFDMPTCQSCHHDGIRETVAINPNGTFKTWADTRFASNVDTPAKGWTLYRYSKGHSNLQCEACHNSTHAEFTDKPSANGNQVNDNLSAVKAQGYAAAIRECTVCHTTMPSTVTGGPHGLHTIGQAWVSGHQGASKTGCTYCHGTTSAGSPLAVVKVQKTLNGRIFAANTRITCWSCHNGPNPD